MIKRYARTCLLPAMMVLCTATGAIAGAAAFDHYAAVYLWPEPEDLVVQQASLRQLTETRTVTFTSTFPLVGEITEAVDLHAEVGPRR